MKKKIIKAIGETEQEIIDNLKYFIKMPFTAQSKEHDYFDVLKDLYHKETGLFANNTLVAFEWALSKLK